MPQGIKLGQIFGVQINIDSSWFFIFLLVTFNLAVGFFPRLHPEWSVFLNWLVGLTASFLFFASVLAHELAHSLVAKSRGLPVKKITLFLFGGVSDIEREPRSAKTEFFMAFIGPLTSIILGIFFIFVGLTNNVLSRLDPISTLFLWLGPINILLGLFNLIPGFPLDGGRILRSIIWAATGNFKTATRIAVIAGRLVSWGFIFIGALMSFGVTIPFFGSGLANGLWLILIGLFLNSAARQSEVSKEK